MDYLLAIDAGTTSLKIVLFNKDGKSVVTTMEEYKLNTPAPNIVELEAKDYWKKTKKGIKFVLERAKVEPNDIKALSISSQGETLIPIDREGDPLRPAIVWLDNRSIQEAKIIKSKFGQKETFQITGQPDIVPTWPATKILWIKRNESEIFKKVHKYLLVEDYLIYKFTGKFVCEGSLISSTLLFNIKKKRWWKDMLKFLGINSSLLPEIRESGEVIGEITPNAYRETGLSPKTLVVTGALDQVAGALGAGNTKPGIITEATGAALAIVATIQKPVFDPKLKIPCHYHAIPNMYYLLPWSPTGGMCLKWFKDNFCQIEIQEAKQKNLDIYTLMDKEANKILPGSERLIMLPYLSGAACPEFNPQARGVFFGITLKHTKAHFIRAILESIAFMLNKNIKTLEKLGVEIKEVRSLGGGAKSKLWNTIKADIIGKPIVTVKAKEVASLGAAILAGVGVGLFNSIEEASRKMVSIKERINPNPENMKVYQEGYDSYLKLYENLKNMFILRKS